MNQDTAQDKPREHKTPLLTPKKKIYLIILGFFLLLLTPILIYSLQLIYYYHALPDFESLALLSKWTDQVIAKDTDTFSDWSQIEELINLTEATSNTESAKAEGPWCPIDTETLDNMMLSYEPALNLWKPLVEQDKAYYKQRTKTYEDIYQYVSSFSERPLDINAFAPDFVELSTIRPITHLLQAKTYNDLENEKYHDALQTIYLNARLVNPLRIQSKSWNMYAQNCRESAFDDYRRLMQYTAPSEVFQKAWSQAISLRKYRLEKEKRKHLTCREDAQVYIMRMHTKKGLAKNKNFKSDKKAQQEILMLTLAEFVQYEFWVLEKCSDEPAKIFQNPEIREEAAGLSKKQDNIFSLQNNPIGYIKSGARLKWLHKAARKDPSFMERRNMPQSLQKKVDPFTALIYLEPGDEWLSKAHDQETRILLIEIALAARSIYTQTGQWPADIQEIKEYYHSNKQKFPAAPYDTNIQFHAGWIQPDFETRKKLWTQQLPLDDFLPEKDTIKKPPRHPNNSDFEFRKEFFSEYTQWSNNPSSATLVIANQYESLSKVDTLAHRFAEHNAIVEKVQIQIILHPETTESNKWKWLTVDSKMIKKIEEETKRLAEAYDKKNPAPAESAFEPIDMGDGKVTYKMNQEVFVRNNKYDQDRNAYIRNPENRTTPYPIRNRMRCWLKAPEKVYAIWNKPPETNKDENLDIDLIVFPEGY